MGRDIELPRGPTLARSHRDLEILGELGLPERAIESRPDKAEGGGIAFHLPSALAMAARAAIMRSSLMT